MNGRIILFAAAVLAALAGSALAATYYVDCDSTVASDSNSDAQATSEATPWKTLWYAGWQAKPGDTVLVKGTNCPDPEDISDIWDHNQAAFLLQDGEAAGRKWTYFKAYVRTFVSSQPRQEFGEQHHLEQLVVVVLQHQRHSSLSATRQRYQLWLNHCERN